MPAAALRGLEWISSVKASESDWRRNSERRRAAVECRCAGRRPRLGSSSYVTVTAAELPVPAESPGRALFNLKLE